MRKIRNPKIDPMWVIGCIDSYGAIRARVCTPNGLQMHTPDLSVGKRWRWNIWGQEYHATLHDDRITQEEIFLIDDWLIKHGHREKEEPKKKVAKR